MNNAEKFTFDIIAQLKECIKQFSHQNGDILYEEKTVYKNSNNTFDNIAVYYMDLYFNNHIVRFSYYPQLPLTTLYSVLLCSVSLSKTDVFFYPLPQIYGFLNITPQNALAIPMILSPNDMTDSFDYISNELLAITPDIADLSYNNEQQAALLDETFEQACTYFKYKYQTEEELIADINKHKESALLTLDKYESKDIITSETKNETIAELDKLISSFINKLPSEIIKEKQRVIAFYFDYYSSRLLDTGYQDYMVGDYKTAVKKLSKQKIKTPYEIQLIDYMKAAKTPQRHIPESIFITLTKLYKNGVPKNGLKEALAIAPAMLIFGVLWVPLFLALYFIFYYFAGRGSIYLLGSLENAPLVILPAMIMAIPTIYFNSKKFYKIFFRKNYQKLIELQNASQSRSAHNFMKGMTVVLLIFSAIFLFLTANQNLKLTDEGFYDNTKFFSVEGNFHYYDEIDMLKYQPETPDGNGGTFPYPSYVIVLKDGTKVEIDQFDSCNEEFLNTLQSKDVKIEPQNDAA